jgi:hypothetical protein
MKIFVSSTFEDLIDHRREVDAVLARLSTQFVGMEYFGARPFEPKVVCFDEIRRSDVFVGIYAHRYGWIPPGNPLSITELEFDEARRNSIPCYCYVVDPNHPWNPTHMELPALEHVKRFHTKVGTLVRSKFTTPDDLAKLLVTDLVSAFTGRDATRQPQETRRLIRTCVTHEIASTVGPKYIRDLYVDRNLDRALALKLAQPDRVPALLLSIADSVGKLRQASSLLASKLESLTVSPDAESAGDGTGEHATDGVPSVGVTGQSKWSGLLGHRGLRKDVPLSATAPNESAIEWSFRAKRSAERLSALVTRLMANERSLQDFAVLANTDHRMNFPATELVQCLQESRGLIDSIQAIHDDHVHDERRDPVQEMRFLSNSIQASHSAITEANESIRPVHLVVDRAGGGKTNLLCHLAEILGESVPSFFVAARSFAGTTEDEFIKHLSSVYPIGFDPILEGVALLGPRDSNCVLVIDGINEHHDPRAFNAVLKSLVRRYYNKPVQFIVSCRDIYWRYFEDDWWRAHGALVARDALYEFTRIEFGAALPKYFDAFDIAARPRGAASEQLRHPLLLRFFCEAFRGSPASPTCIGELSELRLLDLFDAYCDKKFDQIRGRLGLIDADEIHQYVRMIALQMLAVRSRQLSIANVASEARLRFGEQSIRAVGSRYVQILDEDVLIEERPVDSLGHALVSFVYDEFMEYIIARAVWSELSESAGGVQSTLAARTLELLKMQSQFVSITGITIYLGELAARRSIVFYEEYLQGLAAGRAFSTTCLLSRRVAKGRNRPRVFELLLGAYNAASRSLRYEIWKGIEQLAPMHWTLFSKHILDTQEGLPVIHGQHVISAIRGMSQGLSPAERVGALSVLQAIKRGYAPRVTCNRSDEAACKSAMKEFEAVLNGAPQ